VKSIASRIRLQADLSCEFEGHPFSIKASDNMIIVEISDLTTGFRLFRKLSHLNQLHVGCDDLSEWLVLLDSTLEVRVGGICVATGGVGPGSFFGRLVSLNGLRLLPTAALRAALGGHF
jgi:hypothetical protein